MNHHFHIPGVFEQTSGKCQVIFKVKFIKVGIVYFFLLGHDQQLCVVYHHSFVNREVIEKLI